MSTAYSSAKQKYIGNGVTTEWGFDFPIKKHSELKVYLKRSVQPQVLLEEGVDYSFVTDNTITFPIKTGEAKLQATDVLALQRESVFESEYNFSNQQRLEPEEVMHADDNLERQIQELKRDSESAIKVQPTSNINTDEYFIAVESIYENLDNINNVSEHSSDIITCSDNISDISTVSSNIANVNAVGQSISNVNTVANNISDVNTAALNIEAIKDAPNQASAASQSASDASQSATNAANSATASANSATASATSANNSHIWAEGTDAQVQALGGVHSSKGWAEQSTNANIALTNSPYTTNRILEIPQDIKLEIESTADQFPELILKAGSKVYVSTNGTFNPVTIQSDIKGAGDLWTVDHRRELLVVYIPSTNNIVSLSVAHCFSQSTAPTSFLAGVAGWFDISTNTVKYTADSGNNWIICSLPICLGRPGEDHVGWNGYLDQVFNGFGYIGSTVFALPGVKGAIPNGKNEDGTCKTILTTLASVKTQTSTGAARRGWYLQPNGASFGSLPVYSDTQPSQNYIRWFSSKDNQWYNTQGSPELNSEAYILPLALFNTDSTGKITSFEPYTVDSIVNSNASNFSQAGRSYLSGLGMPSSRYIDLTLGANGSTYTAPANGWFVISGKPTADGGYCILDTNGYKPSYMTSNRTGWFDRGFIPVRKGQVMTLRYGNYEFDSDRFKFIYAEGEQNV